MGGMSINSSPEKNQEQLDIVNNAAKQNAKKEADYQSRLQQYMTGGRGAGMGFTPRPEDADAAEAARQKIFGPSNTQQSLPSSIDQPQMKKGGQVHASKRADGIAQRGHTRYRGDKH